MTFLIFALSAHRFSHLYGQSDETLKAIGVKTVIADKEVGFPCRVSLVDAPKGARMLLMNFEHQDAASPYQSSHAIFVADGAQQAQCARGEVPDVLRRRLLSIRSFSDDGMMLNADVAEGEVAAPLIERLLSNASAAYLHLHFARRGCYAARAERAGAR